MVSVLIWLILVSVAAMVYAWAGLREVRQGRGGVGAALRALAPTATGLGPQSHWLVYVFWVGAMVLAASLTILAAL